MTAKAAQQPDSLVSSLQSEVAAEASPLLSLLVAHAGKLVFGIVLFIVLIAGYRLYSYREESLRMEESKALGQLLVIADPKMRLEKLEAFLPTAPESVRGSGWFAVLDAATELREDEKILAAWQSVSRLDENMAVPAGLGMANILSAQGKYGEALRILEGLGVSQQSPDFPNVQSHIALLAELVGDYGKAAAACGLLSSAPGADPAGGKFWSQKKTELEGRAADGMRQGAKQP